MRGPSLVFSRQWIIARNGCILCIFHLKNVQLCGITFPEHAMVQYSSRQERFSLSSSLLTKARRRGHVPRSPFLFIRIRLDLNILGFISNKVEITKDSCITIHGLQETLGRPVPFFWRTLSLFIKKKKKQRLYIES